MKYDYLVFIGRFQPFHNGHKAVIERALALSKKVIVLVGSANGPRSYRNPFTFDERAAMISRYFYWKEEYAEYSTLEDQTDPVSRLIISPLDDYTYNDQGWIKGVQKVVLDHFPGNTPNVTLHGTKDIKVGLIGCSKDESSYYLKLFPEWGHEDVSFVDPLNATDIREKYFNILANGVIISAKLGDYIPATTKEFLINFSGTEEYIQIREEYAFVKKYKKAWENAPYEPIFVTTDAVVVQSGHILLIKRRSAPGKGMWALPGGFLNPQEKIEDGVIRELREETKIKVPEAVLRGSIRCEKVFDEPNRSSRGRTITHAFLLDLRPDTSLPRVKGADDAEKARWVPLADLRADNLFEDHYHIIQDMIGRL